MWAHVTVTRPNWQDKAFWRIRNIKMGNSSERFLLLIWNPRGLHYRDSALLFDIRRSSRRNKTWHRYPSYGVVVVINIGGRGRHAILYLGSVCKKMIHLQYYGWCYSRLHKKPYISNIALWGFIHPYRHKVNYGKTRCPESPRIICKSTREINHRCGLQITCNYITLIR